MASFRFSLSVLFASLLLVAPQANLLRSHTARNAMNIKEDYKTSADASGSGQSEASDAGMTVADFEDPADDARAEAGAETDEAFGAAESIDQDYMDEPDAENTSGQQGQQADSPSDGERGVFNLETGRFEKGASLLQTRDVDDVNEQEEVSDESEDQASDNGEEESSDGSEEQNGDDGEESGDVGDDMDADIDESLLQTGGADDDDEQQADDLKPDENDAAGVTDDDDDSSAAALLQNTKSASDGSEKDGLDDVDADTRMGQDDAKAAEAEALKEAGGKEDEEKKAEREEAEQDEIESMNADSAYNFDGI